MQSNGSGLMYAGTLKELLKNQFTLDQLDPSEYPNFTFMNNGDLFITTRKVTGNRNSSKITSFIIMNRALQPVMGYDQSQVNVADGLIMMAFVRNFGTNTGLGLSEVYNPMANQAIGQNTNINNFLYCIPLNEVVLSRSYAYNENSFSGNTNYTVNRDMFVEKMSIKSLSLDYWNYMNINTPPAASEVNKKWFQDNGTRINALVSGLGTPGSEIEYILSAIRK